MSISSRREAENRIRELRESLNELEDELARHKADESAQHALIDHLDEYIDAVDDKFSSLKMFWHTLRQEWRRARN
jgi:cob(I)alamin adenosyltransferase